MQLIQRLRDCWILFSRSDPYAHALFRNCIRESMGGNRCVDIYTCRCVPTHIHTRGVDLGGEGGARNMLPTHLPVSWHMQTHTSSYSIKTPVIQSTQIGWQAATCVSWVLTDSSERARRWAAGQKSAVCLSAVGRQAAGGEPRRKSRPVGRQRYGGEQEQGRAREGKLIFVLSKAQVQLLGSIVSHTGAP